MTGNPEAGLFAHLMIIPESSQALSQAASAATAGHSVMPGEKNLWGPLTLKLRHIGRMAGKLPVNL
jgi:hypothetical protein